MQELVEIVVFVLYQISKTLLSHMLPNKTAYMVSFKQGTFKYLDKKEGPKTLSIEL
jgi:hypothetical protein